MKGTPNKTLLQRAQELQAKVGLPADPLEPLKRRSKAEVVADQRFDQLKQRDFITLLGGRGVHLVLLPSAWRAFTTFYYFA